MRVVHLHFSIMRTEAEATNELPVVRLTSELVCVERARKGCTQAPSAWEG